LIKFEFLKKPYSVVPLFFSEYSLKNSLFNLSLKIKLINPSISSIGVSSIGWDVILYSKSLGVPFLYVSSLAMIGGS
jgi:hypothetical protein